MERHSRSSPIRMSVLTVRPTLPDLGEPEPLENPGDFAGLENRYVAQLRDLDGLRTDELALQLRLAIFEQHRDDLFQILSQLVDTRALRMGARPAWDIAHEQPCIRVP